MAKPYIGIVGVKNVSEAIGVAAIVGTHKSLLPTFRHRTQLGVQVTPTTLAGGLSSTSLRNPVVTDIPEIFSAALTVGPELFTAIHFTPKDPAIVRDSIRKLFDLGSMYDKGICRGIQLNGMFGKMTGFELLDIKDDFPKLEIILQISGTTLSNMSCAEIVAQVPGARAADFMLIDPSGGRGQEMDVAAGVELARALMAEGLNVGLAGGLKGSNVRRIVSEVRSGLGTNDFSIDAEGGLRDKLGEGYGNDEFNPDKTAEYYSEAVSAFV